MTANQALRALIADLRALGVQPGQHLIVHSSLRRVGPLDGGAETLFEALRIVAGDHATIVVPAQTAGNSWSSPAFLAATAGLSDVQLTKYVAAMPGFDPALTPSAGMGAFAEYVRTGPGAVRSSHPQTSFAAIGDRAAEFTRSHALDCHLGEYSPLGWLYQTRGAVLLLGVGYEACTAMHLSEYLLPGERPRRVYRCFTMEEGRRVEREFTDINLTDGDFASVGARIDRESFVRRGRVGTARCRLIPIRDIVDFTVAWPPFRRRRGWYDGTRRDSSASAAVLPQLRSLRPGGGLRSFQ
jgi:aminoglycoside N3'-acetyltransferase